MNDTRDIMLRLESLPPKKRSEIKKSLYNKALADLPPLEQANVKKAINDIRELPECSDGLATEIVAALGMFLDRDNPRAEVRVRELEAT